MFDEFIRNQNYSDLNPVIFGYEDCTPGYSYGPTVRKYWLLHYIVSGSGRFEKQGTVYNLSKGDIFVIAPHELTFYQADSADPWSYIWLGFTSEKLPFDFSETPVIHCPTAEPIFKAAKQCEKMDSGKSAFLAARLWDLCSLLISSNYSYDNFVDVAIDFIKAEYMHKISIEQIAKRLNLSRAYFSRAFKARCGVSPQTYLNNYRLNAAAELMVKHNQPPTIAANSCGYSDVFSFSKMFKQHFGVSPREYIKQNSN